jgi:7-keto-8-aminopelargonate synthetase-like enzyme
MALFEAGIFSNIGTTPAVNVSKCRLRLNVMATHSPEQLAWAADTLEKLGKKTGVI